MGQVQDKRLQYLQAMGVQTWSLRQPLIYYSSDELEENTQDSIGLSSKVLPEPDSQIPPEDINVQTQPSAELNKISADVHPTTEVPHSKLVDSSSPVPDWKCLAFEVKDCIKCKLSESRSQTVFGVGNRDADWMLITEAPSEEEEAQGEAFVGRLGPLFNQMLLAVGLRREQVYITNVLKCRTPDDRDPHKKELAACASYLDQQIALVKPKLILAVGRIAAHHLLKTDQKLGDLRGRELFYGEDNTPVVVTYHPAYLLRSPSDKRKSWQDLLRARNIVNNVE